MELRLVIAYTLIALMIAAVAFVARRMVKNSRKVRRGRRRYYY